MSPRPLVLVTGAAGYVASHIVVHLLEKGYRVRGTVRSLAKRDKIKHVDLPGVELVEADLLTPNSFDKAVQGCDYVLHTASPYTMSLDNPQKNIVDPAVNGTLNVLKSCLKAPTIKRVVYTSSMAAITDDFVPTKVYTEADWNMKSSLSRNPYHFSKRVAEQAALRFLEDHKSEYSFSFVVMAPTLVMGPTLEEKDPPLNVSNMIIKKIVNGEIPGILELGFPIIDVRDSAAIHVILMESDKAHGRYIACNRTLWMKEVCDLVKAKFPSLPVPFVDMRHPVVTHVVRLGGLVIHTGILDYVRTSLGKNPMFSSDRISKEFDYKFRDYVETLYDTVADLKAKGFLTNKHVSLIPKL